MLTDVQVTGWTDVHTPRRMDIDLKQPLPNGVLQPWFQVDWT